MLLTRSIPPQLLLPAWGAHHYQALQRAYNSNSSASPDPSPTSPQSTRKPTVRRHLPPSRIKSRLNYHLSRRSLPDSEAAKILRELKDSPAPAPHPTEKKTTSKPLVRRIKPGSSTPTFKRPLNHRPLDSEAAEILREVEEPSPAALAPVPRPPLPDKKSKPFFGSLWEQLFPEEAPRPPPPKPKKPERIKPFEWNVGPAFDVERISNRPKEDAFAILREQLAELPKKESTRGTPETLKRNRWKWERAIVLSLNLASPMLEESDFFRVSPRGEHIAGWTNGILKVIQARDANTLRPLGNYYLLFHSPAAALAYLKQTNRLHRISRNSAGSLSALTLPAQSIPLNPGEDLPSLIRAFTLIPGPVSLQLDHVTQPLTPAMVSMLSSGGLYFLTRLQASGEGTVLLSVDVGLVSVQELRDAILLDGRRRNLHWRVVTEEGIVPIYREGTEEEMSRAGEDGREGGKGGYKRPARFVISFEDQEEARRFIRDWHRRPFRRAEKSSRGRGLGDDRDPIISATIMW